MFRLYDLAIDVLGSLIFDITVKLGELSMERKFETSIIQDTVNYVENMLQSNIPASIANDVSSRLQPYILYAVDDIYRKFNVNSISRKWQEEIVIGMWIAVIHPSITSFEYSYRASYTCSIPKYSSELLKVCFDRIFAKVKNVYIVKLDIHMHPSREKIFNNLYELDRLVELTFRGCNNAAVIALSEKCRHLKKLDINGSCYVSDDSVAAIVRFSSMKYLDVRGTFISIDGITKIITNMRHLNVLNSILTASHLLFLQNCTSNLSCLGLYLVNNCTSLPLRFKNLTSLSISFKYTLEDSFISLKESLIEVGPRLFELRLHNVTDTDLHFIAEKCPSLKLLGLYFSNTNFLGLPDTYNLDLYTRQYPLPVLPSVECCEFDLGNCCLIQHILSSFVNVKKIMLIQLYKPFCFLFKQIIEVMRERNLTELYVKGNRFKLSGCNLLICRADGSVCTESVEELLNIVTDIYNVRRREYRERGFYVM